MLSMRLLPNRLSSLKLCPANGANLLQTGIRPRKTALTSPCHKRRNLKTSSAIGVLCNDTYGHTDNLRKGDYEWQEPENEEETVHMEFVDKHGKKIPTKGRVGLNIMFLAQEHDLDIEGACGGFAQCCTCHVYVDPDYYSILPEPEVDEEDMLDKAAFLKENSRLCCQLVLSKKIEGMQVTLPPATLNFYVDGHIPKHH